MVTADCVVVRDRAGVREVLLIRRGKAPMKGRWALPGGFVEETESLEAAALRELREETGLKGVRLLAQVGAYGDPGRDPRGRVITVAFLVKAPPGAEVRAGDDAKAAKWFPVARLPGRMAFDHERIVGDASKLQRTTTAQRSRECGNEFGVCPRAYRTHRK